MLCQVFEGEGLKDSTTEALLDEQTNLSICLVQIGVAAKRDALALCECVHAEVAEDNGLAAVCDRVHVGSDVSGITHEIATSRSIDELEVITSQPLQVELGSALHQETGAGIVIR